MKRKMEVKEGDFVLCTVEKIIGTTVFVKIEDNGEGTIITSEIAPGRIRNLRDYVVPNKKIVCKVLSIKNGNISLSLRRVSPKERQEVMRKYETEKRNLSILKVTLQEKYDEVVKKIKESYESITDFFESLKSQPKLIEKYIKKEIAEKISKILKEKKEKKVSVKKKFSLSTNLPEGIKIIKNILDIKNEGVEITYLAGSKYLLKVKASDYKEANNKLRNLLEEIEKRAKGKAKFEVEK